MKLSKRVRDERSKRNEMNDASRDASHDTMKNEQYVVDVSFELRIRS